MTLYHRQAASWLDDMWMIDLSQAIEDGCWVWKRILQPALRPPPQLHLPPLLLLRGTTSTTIAADLFLISKMTTTTTTMPSALRLVVWLYSLATQEWTFIGVVDSLSVDSSSRYLGTWLSDDEDNEGTKNEKEKEKEKESEEEEERRMKRAKREEVDGNKESLIVWLDAPKGKQTRLIQLNLSTTRVNRMKRGGAVRQLKEVCKKMVAFLPEYAALCTQLQKASSEGAVQLIMQGTQG